MHHFFRQEHEYLRHVAARIVAFEPNVVLVQRNVSRLAQDFLREQGVTLVHNVKESILERLSRCTDADLVSNVDAHIGRPKLATCQKFYLKTYEVEKSGSKTFMFFEGLPHQHLGCTVVLRGASELELAKVKKVASFYLFAHYNWRLEKSFLMDEYALPPKDDIFEDSKESSPLLPVTNKFSEVIPKSDKQEASKEPVEAFSDPLRNLENDYNCNGNEKLSVAELPFTNEFRKALNGTILSVSPYIGFSMPYLETELGKKCKLRSFFPEDIYFSKQFTDHKVIKFAESDTCIDVENSEEEKVRINLTLTRVNLIDQQLAPPHPFITTKLTTNAESTDVQNMLANFRACGGRYKKKKVLVLAKEEKDKNCKKNSVSAADKYEVFDPMNHQRLAVLFCSFSHESHNAPAFCVNPW